MTDDDTCPDCGEYLDECECEEEESVIDDLHDLVDVANKGADAYNKWKDILNPTTPKIAKTEKYFPQKPENSVGDNELRAKKRYKMTIILGLASIGIGIGGYVIAFIL
jgi:hypothetical protein